MLEQSSVVPGVDIPTPTWSGRDPAIFSAKQIGGYALRSPDAIAHSIGVSFQDKGFDPDAINFLGAHNSLGELTSRFLGRLVPQDGAYERLLSNGAGSDKIQYDGSEAVSYTGSENENRRIDQAYKDINHYSNSNKDWNPVDRNSVSGFGATPYFNSQETRLSPEVKDVLAGTPVVILGAGAAGILTAYGLSEMGFSDITIIDKKKDRGGIWAQKNVREGTINTPFDLRFNKLYVPRASHDFVKGRPALWQRNRPEGGEVNYDFLQKAFENSGAKIIEGQVKSVVPSDLHHTVEFDSSEGPQSIVAPIVINALGATSPLNPSHESRMTTRTPLQAGRRWQKQFTDAELKQLKGKQVVEIGLGNSSMEDAAQLLEAGVDFAILTHMNRRAIADPKARTDLVVRNDGKSSYKSGDSDNPSKYGSVFRNFEVLDLSNVAGDLAWVNNTFMAARNSGRIYPEIVEWARDEKTKKVHAIDVRGNEYSFKADQLATNIGYGNDPAVMNAMGATVIDEYKGSIAVDYDGEIQKKPGTKGRERVYPGYFGVGSILKSDWNPNAQVMGGIMHKVYDICFTASVRAVEKHVRASV